MFRVHPKYTCTVFTIVLYLVALSTSLPANRRNKRSQPLTDLPQPSERLPVHAYNDSIKDIHKKILDIQLLSSDAIESLKLTTWTKRLLNGMWFLAAPNVTEDKIIQLKHAPVTALRGHIALISGMFFHIRKCHSDGEIGQQSPNDTQTVRYHIQQVSGDLQNMNSSLNFMLHQQIPNEPADTTTYSSLFQSGGRNYTNEYYRAYIILNDNINLMAYLLELYETVFPYLKTL